MCNCIVCVFAVFCGLAFGAAQLCEPWHFQHLINAFMQPWCARRYIVGAGTWNDAWWIFLRKVFDEMEARMAACRQPGGDYTGFTRHKHTGHGWGWTHGVVWRMSLLIHVNQVQEKQTLTHQCKGKTGKDRPHEQWVDWRQMCRWWKERGMLLVIPWPTVEQMEKNPQKKKMPPPAGDGGGKEGKW